MKINVNFINEYLLAVIPFNPNLVHGSLSIWYSLPVFLSYVSRFPFVKVLLFLSHLHFTMITFYTLSFLEFPFMLSGIMDLYGNTFIIYSSTIVFMGKASCNMCGWWVQPISRFSWQPLSRMIKSKEGPSGWPGSELPFIW